MVSVTHRHCHSLFMHPSIHLSHYKLHNPLVETAFSNQSIQILVELAPCNKKYNNNINASKDQHSWYHIFCVLYLTELFISSDYIASITHWMVNVEMVRMWAGTIMAWSRHYIRICLEGLRKNICQGCQDNSIQTLPVRQ